MCECALQAVRLVRYSSLAWSINPSKIGVVGFSVGGHIAAMLCTHCQDSLPALPPYLQGDSPKAIVSFVANVFTRPDFAILVYPVITMMGADRHPDSAEFLLKVTEKEPSTELYCFYSAEMNVHSGVPPTLIIQSKNDALVSSNNSRLYYQACKAANVTVELHLISGRCHGYGMVPDNNHSQEENSWHKSYLMEWLRFQKLLV